VVIGAAIWYDGMTGEAAASGSKGGNKGSTSAEFPPSTPASAAADAADGLDFFVAFFFFFLPPAKELIKPPKQQHDKAATISHSQICKLNPPEPDSVDPELAAEPDASLAKEPSFKNAECIDAAESSPLEPEDESHGVPVVDGAWVFR